MNRLVPWFLITMSVAGNCAITSAATTTGHLHVLLAMDTDARAADGVSGIGTARDLEIWASVIGEIRQGREGRVSLTVAQGRTLTPDAIVNFYRALGQRPGWSLLFVYSGHGATGSDGDHYMTFTHGGNLSRSRLREAMEGTGASLQVILTDCCGSVVPFDAVRRPVPAEWAMFEQLFFENAGMVDVLSCEIGAVSLGNDVSGGMFTRACTRLLCSPVSESDGDGNGQVTWTEFFTKVRADTQRIAAGTGRSQSPTYWYLGGRQRFDQVLASAEAALRRAHSLVDSLVARAHSATTGRSARQAASELQVCSRLIAVLNKDMLAHGMQLNAVKAAAIRAGLLDAATTDAANVRMDELVRFSNVSLGQAQRMQEWARRAAACP